MLRFISLFVLSEHCVQDGQQFTHTVNQRHFFGFSGCWQMINAFTAEQLELMRSAFRVIRTVREKHACTQCDAIVQAPVPSRPIERGVAGPGLLARVLTSKYAEHTPLYRQSEIYGRQGVELSRSLLSGWVDACCRLLSPLEEALHGDVMTDGKLHADDTPVSTAAG